MQVFLILVYLMMHLPTGRSRRQAAQCRSRAEAERRQRLTSQVGDDDARRRARRVDSDYDRHRLHDSWARNLQQIYGKAGTPDSLWWTQYMLMATVRPVSYTHLTLPTNREV